ncbi:E1A-binding protein p400-like [Bos mutus]|uniref:E1A-binding protein p400-like n=1 Tax=Bos mutus TaxID=72004 RepID=UPI0038B66189
MVSVRRTTQEPCGTPGKPLNPLAAGKGPRCPWRPTAGRHSPSRLPVPGAAHAPGATPPARRPALQRPPPPKRELQPPPGGAPGRPRTSVVSSEAMDMQSARRVDAAWSRRKAQLPAPFRPLLTSAINTSRSLSLSRH